MNMDLGSPGIVIGLTLLASEMFVAIFTIVFIISVLLRGFHREKKLNTKDEIQLALKVSSLVFMTVLPYNEFSHVLQPNQTSHVRPLFTVAIVYCMSSCSWLLALQCFFYFIKIVQFQWIFIPWMKMRIDSIVHWLIVVLEVVSLCTSLLHLLPYIMAYVPSTNSSYISSPNTTPELNIVIDYVSYLMLIGVHCFVLMSIIATFITAAFLQWHMKKMMDTNTSREVHQYKHVVTAILRFLLLYFMFYIGMILYYFSILTPYSIGYWINLVLVFSFIPTINIIQILGTPHLRTTWKKMMGSFTLCREPHTQ